MSAILLERAAVGHGAWQAVADRIGQAIGEIRRQHKARRDRRHLMQLPDYLLKDIGISRLEIEAMAGRGEKRHFPVVPEIGWRQNLSAGRR